MVFSRGGGFERGCEAGGDLQDACRAARGAYSGGGEVRAAASDHRARARAGGVPDHVLPSAAAPEGSARSCWVGVGVRIAKCVINYVHDLVVLEPTSLE